MNIGFQESAVHRISKPITGDFSDKLIHAIHWHTNWNYCCVQSGDGYLLKPTFRDMPYRNSFLPEISVSVSQCDGQISLSMKGKPIIPVRVFMWFWFGFLLVMWALLIFVADTSALDSIFPFFVPGIMLVGGYLLCKLGMTIPFRSIVKAIQNEFP